MCTSTDNGKQKVICPKCNQILIQATGATMFIYLPGVKLKCKNCGYTMKDEQIMEKPTKLIDKE